MQLSTSCYPAKTHLGLHCRDTVYLSVVLRGSYVESVGTERLLCSPLSLRLHPAGEEHSHVFGTAGAHCFNVELDHRWQETMDRLQPFTRRPLLIGSVGRLGLRATSLVQSREVDVVDVEELVTALLDACEQHVRIARAAERSAAIKRVLGSIEDNLHTQLSLTSLANEAGLHPTHFARSFKAATGLTVGEFIRRRRVARAQLLLSTDPHASISRVAAACGFADHAHLTRTFQNLVGASPSYVRNLTTSD